MPTSRVPPAEPAKAGRGVSAPIRAIAAVLMLASLTAACEGSNKTDTSANTSTTLSPAAMRLQAGLAAQGVGQLDKAREEYLAVITLEPSNKIAPYNLGVVHQQLNDVKAASDSYRKALAIDPNYQPALFNLAVLLTESDPPAAVSYYRQILAISPSDSNVHFNLGLLLRQMGQEAEGNAEVAKALELNPALASRLPASGSTSTTVTR